MKTGRDVVIAALLGAEEYGFATAPLVVSGCVMMRVCHLDTCPVGVATQNPELRKRFTGKPEFVETFFEYIAEEVREWLAKLGFRSLDEAIGQVEVLDTKKAIDHWKASGLDLSPILDFPTQSKYQVRKREITQNHGLDGALDFELLELANAALDSGKHTVISMPITNRNRTVGTILGSEITKRFGGSGLPDDTIEITLHGSAGQSLGAFIPRGLTIRLYGDVNDHLGKGLSGGRLIVRPDEKSNFDSEKNIIAGNVVGYGATSGEILVRGIVGERFCVRNSGATAVVEGTGDHGCEYMTGGTVVVLGKTGRNFAAGMSGGVTYLLDLDPRLVNQELVDLQPVPAEDSEPLLKIISKFFAETGSKVADSLMKDWQTSLTRFTRVMPRDYARVLKVISNAESSGKDVSTAIIEVLNG
jgi:glutamate synthase (NADPH/NADH) large chain